MTQKKAGFISSGVSQKNYAQIDYTQISYSKGLALVAKGGKCLTSLKANQSGVEHNQRFFIAGVDEAGRGPLLGPVSVAAVVLDDTNPIAGLNDSKKLSAKKRLKLFDEIVEKSLAYCVVFVSPLKIDEINILQATILGMAQSIKALGIAPDKVLIDGNKNVVMTHPDTNAPISSEAVIGGDALHEQISAASILAKVSRDAYMEVLHAKHPDYAINKHKGYPTKLHLEKLGELGVLTEHRRSFKPVAKLL